MPSSGCTFIPKEQEFTSAFAGSAMHTGRSKSGQSAEGSWRGTVNGKQVTFEKPTGCALWFSRIQGKGVAGNRAGQS
jgi:hypothetical protein